MSQEELLAQLNFIEKKLHKLLLKCDTLKREHSRLLEENLELKDVVRKQEEEIQYFRNQEKITNIVTSIASGSNDADGFKKKLDEYIEEVEKCIEHLSK